MKTYYDYLPHRLAWVRVRVGNLNSVAFLPPTGVAERVVSFRRGGGTFLARVQDLEAIASRYPHEKVSVSLAAYSNGQSQDCVVLVTAVAVDLDAPGSWATREMVELLRKRFPEAALIWSNGVTLLFPLDRTPQTHRCKAVQAWHDALPAAFQVGREAERLSGLTYDVGTHFCANGSPAEHAAHLFRAPFGWADRRKAVPEFFAPLSEDRSNGRTT
ncbi:hypothetical protein DB347_17650 [Opitutaceae bacterium EW11]|nr:hypothetical protein DB347_17650 [Opitutaceae bacterium EW11]